MSKSNRIPSAKYGATIYAAVMVIVLLFSFGRDCLGAIAGPYTVDPYTLHLWHLDEVTVPAKDSASGGTNLTALGGSASLNNLSLSGFGKALDTSVTTGDYLAPRTLAANNTDDTLMTYADATTGAFTFEAIVRINFNPATFNRGNVPLYLIMGENEAGDRPWQFRIHTNGVAGAGLWQLQFFNLGMGSTPFFANLPTNGPDAILQNNWYHVAVTFDGADNGGHLNLYWTLMNGTRTTANLIGSATMANLTPIATGNIDFVLGNVSRNTPNGNFMGLIDEVRISSIARSPFNMVFATTNVDVLVPPANQTVVESQPFTLSVLAAGLGTLSYQWRFNGVNIPNGTRNVYSNSAAQLFQAGNYDVLVSNAVGTVTSSVAMVVVATTNPVWLNIGRSGANILLTWPVSTTDWSLQTASPLASGGSWQVLSNLSSITNNRYYVQIQNAGGQSMFRLVGALIPPADSSVAPINWSSFQAGVPTDANAVRVASILQNASKYALTTWWNTARNYAAQDATNYLDFGGVNETSIRSPAMEAYGLTVALQTGVYDPVTAGVSASDARSRTLKLIRSLGYRHLANGSGGWGNVWESALWAALAGTSGWMVWPELSAADQEYVRRMVEYEANRFINYPVPYYQNRAGTIISPGDTKSEENAWNASILHLAVCMMPGHSNVLAWRSKALELTISTYARPSDINRTNTYNGRTLAAWLNGSNANEDGTVINHNIVHPDYICSGLNEFQPALVYLLAGKPVPQSSFFNLDQAYHAMVDLNFIVGATPYPTGLTNNPPGGFIFSQNSSNQPTTNVYYPNDNDWGTSRRMHFAMMDANVHAFGLDGSAKVSGDVLEALHDQTVLDMQARFTDGRTYGATSEDTYALREEWVCHFAGKNLLTKWLLHQSPIQITNDP